MKKRKERKWMLLYVNGVSEGIGSLQKKSLPF
jgi:hypothetical protein